MTACLAQGKAAYPALAKNCLWLPLCSFFTVLVFGHCPLFVVTSLEILRARQVHAYPQGFYTCCFLHLGNVLALVSFNICSPWPVLLKCHLRKSYLTLPIKKCSPSFPSAPYSSLLLLYCIIYLFVYCLLSLEWKLHELVCFVYSLQPWPSQNTLWCKVNGWIWGQGWTLSGGGNFILQNRSR